jgi:hypothetical protein
MHRRFRLHGILPSWPFLCHRHCLRRLRRLVRPAPSRRRLDRPLLAIPASRRPARPSGMTSRSGQAAPAPTRVLLVARVVLRIGPVVVGVFLHVAGLLSRRPTGTSRIPAAGLEASAAARVGPRRRSRGRPSSSSSSNSPPFDIGLGSSWSSDSGSRWRGGLAAGAVFGALGLCQCFENRHNCTFLRFFGSAGFRCE